MLRILYVLELSNELITFYIPGLLPGSFGTKWSPQEPAELICGPRICVHRSGSIESLCLTVCVIYSCLRTWSIPGSSLFRICRWSFHNMEGRSRMFMLEFWVTCIFIVGRIRNPNGSSWEGWGWGQFLLHFISDSGLEVYSAPKLVLGIARRWNAVRTSLVCGQFLVYSRSWSLTVSSQDYTEFHHSGSVLIGEGSKLKVWINSLLLQTLRSRNVALGEGLHTSNCWTSLSCVP
jgi:hypothetical protein